MRGVELKGALQVCISTLEDGHFQERASTTNKVLCVAAKVFNRLNRSMNNAYSSVLNTCAFVILCVEALRSQCVMSK